MLDTNVNPKPKQKRRGNKQKYNDYMRQYMQQWRARRRIKPVEENGTAKGT